MKSKNLRKSVLIAGLLMAVYVATFTFQQPILGEQALQATKHYTASFYTVVDVAEDEELVATRGDKKYVRRVVLASPSSDELHGSADEVIYVDGKSGMKTICLYNAPEEPTYAAEVQEVTITEPIGPADEFEVVVTVKNTGDANWFSHDSGCENQVEVKLGTELGRDRESVFGTEKYALDGWLDPTRIAMLEEVVEPEETATFTFSSKTAWVDKWYKEFFAVVIDDEIWLDDALVEVDIKVGSWSSNVDMAVMEILEFSANSGDLDGEKHIKVDLSDQYMYIYTGDVKIGDFQVSTGAWETPTPTGTYYVLNRQELRIGGAWPHYRMPNWQGFTSVGHGLHALPYLSNDGGAFWYEALDHIGTPVSHGCIRMLPDDSDLLYDFGFVGMRIDIQN